MRHEAKDGILMGHTTISKANSLALPQVAPQSVRNGDSGLACATCLTKRYYYLGRYKGTLANRAGRSTNIRVLRKQVHQMFPRPRKSLVLLVSQQYSKEGVHHQILPHHRWRPLTGCPGCGLGASYVESLFLDTLLGAFFSLNFHRLLDRLRIAKS